MTVRTALLTLFVLACSSSSALAAGEVQIGITGAGSVGASGISCSRAVGGALSGDCSESYTNTIRCSTIGGQQICFPVMPSVTFTASTGANGFAFDSWTGLCAGQGAACTASVSSDARFSAVFKDVADPTVALTAPGVLLTGMSTLTAVAKDNAGVARVDFSLGGATVSDATAPYSADFDTAALPNGVARARAVAVDTSGRTKEHAFDVVVDNPVPVVEAPPAEVAPLPGVPAPVSVAPPAAVPAAPAPQIRVGLAFTFRNATRRQTTLTSLVVRDVPAGATVSAKGFKKSNAKGDVSLKALLRRPLKAGTSITVTVSKPGMGTAIKTLRILPRKAPKVTTACQAPGAAKPSAC